MKTQSTGSWGKATAAKRYNLGGPISPLANAGGDGVIPPQNAPNPMNMPFMAGAPGQPMMPGMKRGGAAKKGK